MQIDTIYELAVTDDEHECSRTTTLKLLLCIVTKLVQNKIQSQILDRWQERNNIVLAEGEQILY